MNKKILFDQDYCKIYFVPSHNCILIKWFEFPHSSDFRFACNFVIELMIRYNTGKLFTDNTDAKVFSVADQKWLNSEWLPKAIEAGYSCSATVMNDDIFIKTAINKIANNRDSNSIKTKVFTNEVEALSWLDSI
ncbi:MAG: hypothetical protein JEY96_15425 [Bacteroidales bacterium]|nr:hypothetical protein [Bacteroidales bacterium]